MHDEPRCDNWSDPKLHDSASVGSENHTHPIEGICASCGVNAIQRELAAYQENEEGDDGVYHLLSEGDFPISALHFRQKRKEGSHQMKNSKSTSHLALSKLETGQSQIWSAWQREREEKDMKKWRRDREKKKGNGAENRFHASFNFVQIERQ